MKARDNGTSGQMGNSISRELNAVRSKNLLRKHTGQPEILALVVRLRVQSWRQC
jgi:hypothetical protein